MKSLTIAEAGGHLAELVAEAHRGEPVLLTDGGKLVILERFDPLPPSPVINPEVDSPELEAELLKGVPLRPALMQSELTTPTGAAILTSVVSEYVDTPTMTIEKIGHGAGSKDIFEQPNLLRIFSGTCMASSRMMWRRL